MRRLLQIFLNATAILSTFLCVALTNAALKGERGEHVTLWKLTKHDVESRNILTPPAGLTIPPHREFHILGFEWDIVLYNDIGRGYWYVARELVIPTWFLSVLTAILPALMIQRWLRQHRSARRKARGLCTTCGYDLQATPHRCPECGRAVK